MVSRRVEDVVTFVRRDGRDEKVVVVRDGVQVREDVVEIAGSDVAREVVQGREVEVVDGHGGGGDAGLLRAIAPRGRRGLDLRRAVGGRCGRGTSDPGRLGGAAGRDGEVPSKIIETRGAGWSSARDAARERTARACFAASRPDANASPPDAVVSSRTPSKVPAVVMSGCRPSRRERDASLFRSVARRRGLDRARAFGDGAATFDGSRGDVRRLARVQSDVPTRVVRDDSRRAK